MEISHLSIKSRHNKDSVRDVSFKIKRGEILCIAGIEGNGQTDLVYGITGLHKLSAGKIMYKGVDLARKSIRYRSINKIAHIPEDRHKHGLVLDYNLAENLILQTYFTPQFQKNGFLRFSEIYTHADQLIKRFDIRSGSGAKSVVRSMSGGNQQKAILARELDINPDLLIAVQPTRGLDVGAIEYIHNTLIEQRDAGKAVLLISLELSEVMSVSDRILVIYEGELVGELDPAQVSQQELGLYMSGSKREKVE